jgi:hypothetical protein
VSRIKKVYVSADEVTSINIIYVHPDFPADAGGAKCARECMLSQPEILIQVSHDKVHIVDPRIRTWGNSSAGVIDAMRQIQGISGAQPVDTAINRIASRALASFDTPQQKESEL